MAGFSRPPREESEGGKKEGEKRGRDGGGEKKDCEVDPNHVRLLNSESTIFSILSLLSPPAIETGKREKREREKGEKDKKKNKREEGYKDRALIVDSYHIWSVFLPFYQTRGTGKKKERKGRKEGEAEDGRPNAWHNIIWRNVLCTVPLTFFALERKKRRDKRKRKKKRIACLLDKPRSPLLRACQRKGRGKKKRKRVKKQRN